MSEKQEVKGLIRAKNVTLPDKMSDLLLLTVKDCKKVESMPRRVKFQMGLWMAPRPTKDSTCRVDEGEAAFVCRNRTLGTPP
jgi:hypothetical protein